MSQPIAANSVLPAVRTPLTLTTADGLSLVAELATPTDVSPKATIVCVHPLPTHGGMMDSHLMRKMAWRLPALADIAVLRFNTRGTASAAGMSEGEFDSSDGEGQDLLAAIAEVTRRGLPDPWLVGWSFGTDVVLRHGNRDPVLGAVLISPPLHFAGNADLDAWAVSERPIVALIPELDDYLRPTEAAERFARIPQLQLVPVEGAKHLWVGEPNVRIVLSEIVRAANPAALDSTTGLLPTDWSGSMEKWSDL